MALTKKTIKQKIKTAGSIKKTTKTMEMISAVKMRRLTARTQGVRLYARYALELIEGISGMNRTIRHPLLSKREEGRVLLVIVGSNKGLCGGYNTNISKKLRTALAESALDAASTDVVAVGKQAERIAHRAKLPIKASFPGLSEIATPDEVRVILDLCVNEFISSAAYKKVMILHTAFIKPLEYAPTLRRLLPLSTKMAEELAHAREAAGARQMNTEIYAFEPSMDAILSQALPQLLLAVFFEAVLESLASEHGSRMVAMKNATDNAKAMQEELTLWFNKARQASITQEIAEISGGAEALAGATLSV